MGLSYRHGERVEHKRFRKDTAVAVTIVVLVFAGALFLLFNAQGQTSINGDNNRPQVRKAAVNTDVTTFEEDAFTVTVPGLWAKADPDFQSERGAAGQTQYHYKTIGVGNEGRLLDVFVDNLPSNEDVSKILPVTIAGDKMIAGDISRQCREFTSYQTEGQIVLSKWENHEFLCNSSEFMNTIGVATGDFSQGVKLTDPTGVEHAYMIIYTDHSRNQANSILPDILREFHAR